MSQTIEFGTDGVRDVYDSRTTPDVANRLATAARNALGIKNWVIVQDTRNFNEGLAEETAAGLAEVGGQVIDMGVLPTPAAAILAHGLSSGDTPWGAISLSASHNPAEFYGIKVFGARGTKLDDEATARVQALANQTRYNGRAAPAPAGKSTVDALKDSYIKYMLETLDPELVAHKFLKGQAIVLDTANGAANWSAQEVFERLGADVRLVKNGKAINEGCGATHPEQMAEMAAELHAIGIALDGDADRLISYENRILDGDDSLAIALMGLRGQLRPEQRGVVVTPYTNLGFEDWIKGIGAGYLEVANGDRYVLEGLKNGFALGGENSGHTLFPLVAEAQHGVLTGDGTLTALQLLQARHVLGMPMNEISNWDKQPHILRNIELSPGINAKDIVARPDIAEKIKTIEAEFASVGRTLVRASGTEPVVRVLVKGGRDTAEAKAVARRITAVLQEAA